MFSKKKDARRHQALMHSAVTSDIPVSQPDVVESFVATDNPEVLAVLKEFDQLKACVHADGLILYVAKQLATRPFNRLKEVVLEAFGALKLEEVSAAQFSRISANWERSEDYSDSTQTKSNTDVEDVLQAAIEANASDIYLLLHQRDTQLRFRVHGLMYEFARYSSADGRQLVRALWSLADSGHFHMDTPTDCIFDYGGRRIRGNSLPDTRGCSVVLRLRDPSFRLELDSLGYEASQLEAIQGMFDSPHGLSVIGGTTNSGKSTTLTALMASLDCKQHVIEIADPIEIEFDHVTHSEINNYAEDASLTFRAKLAALVRQNPDYLFLGEIRDLDSSTAAVHMAMQGKRIWSTVHTGDCVSTLTRLEILGIEHDQLSAPNFLNGIINQSLIPRLCSHCSSDVPIVSYSYREYESIDELFDAKTLRYLNPDGCEFCYQGLAGQTVIAEVWPLCSDLSRQAQDFIQNRQYQQLLRYVRERFGQMSKFEHAAQKIRSGLIDPFITQKIVGSLRLEEGERAC